MKAKIALAAFLFAALGLTCRFRTVDYAVGAVELASKTPTVVDGKPAIKLDIRNSGEAAVFNVHITVKAKKRQRTLQESTVLLDTLPATAQETRTIIFDRLASHQDYDLITYAVSFSGE